MVSKLKKGGVLLINAPYEPDEVWDKVPCEVQQQIIGKQAKLYAIDANSIAKSVGLGGRINIIMQAAFFKISGVLPEEEALKLIEWLTTEEAQRVFVDINMEFPANGSIEPSREVAAWGDFKADTINVEVAGRRQPEAIMLMDRLGWN